MSATDTTSVTGTPTETDVEAVRERLEAAGVRYALAGFSDVHGRLKGKVVPISHLANMAGGSELFTGARRGRRTAGDQRRGDFRASRPDRVVQLPWRRRWPGSPPLSIPRASRSSHAPARSSDASVDGAAELGSASTSASRPSSSSSATGSGASSESPTRRQSRRSPAYDVAPLLDNFALARRAGRRHERARLGRLLLRSRGRQRPVRDRLQVLPTPSPWPTARVLPADGRARSPAGTALLATFMPKPFADRTGNGAHFNMSLCRSPRPAQPVRSEAATTRTGLGLSKLGYHFIAGILRHGRRSARRSRPRSTATSGSIRRRARCPASPGRRSSSRYGDEQPHQHGPRPLRRGPGRVRGPPTSAATPISGPR